MYAVTFFSYKGGVGRTMALANAAVALAKRKRSVLLWEMDLEAPGLLNIPGFQPLRKKVKGGVANLLADPPSDWKSAVRNYVVTHPNYDGRLRILPAGPTEDYARLYQRIPWDRYFGNGNTAGALALQNIWKAIETLGPDFLLIDSRTGLTDTGAVCTVQLPHLVVLVYQLTHQSLAGTREIQGILTRMGQKREYRGDDLDIFRVASMVPLGESPALLRGRRDASKSIEAEYNLESHIEIPLNSSLLLEETLMVEEFPDHPIALEYSKLAAMIDGRNPVAEKSEPREFRRGAPDDRVQRGKEFEDDVAELLRLLGFEVKVNILRDGSQIDIEATEKRALSETYFIVECKDHQKPASVDDVRNLFTRVHASTNKRAQGLLISRRGFTAEAKAQAESLAVIRLATFDELLRSLVDLTAYRKALLRGYEGTPIERLYIEPDAIQEGKDSPEPVWPLIEDWLTRDEEPFLAVLGDYGTGKTCLARRLAYRLAQRYEADTGSRQPLLIELKEVSKAFNLDTVLTYHFQQSAVRVDARVFLYALQKGQFVLILDGFDEMAIQMDWSSTVANLRELLRAASGKAKVLLTCRTEFFKDQTAQDKALRGETELYREIFGVKGARMAYLRDFTDAQVDEYLTLACQENAEPVRNIVHSIPSLKDISGRPVMLDMIVSSAPQLGRLGGDVTVGGLYQAYTQRWLEREDPKLRLTREGRRALVQELAWQLWESGEPRLHHSKLSGVLRNYLKGRIETETEFEIADQEVRTASFLTRVEGTYGFSHRSFMEFFLAERMATDGVNLQVRTLSDAVIGFLLDLCGKEKLSQITRKVLAAEYKPGVSENAVRIAARIGAWPKRAQLAGAQLEGFVLPGASLQGADLQGANLTNADLTGADLQGANLRKATLDRARLERANLLQAQLAEASLQGATLDDADCSGVDFTGADLRFASLLGATLTTLTLKTQGCAIQPQGALRLIRQGGLSSGVNSVAIHPDGTMLAAGSDDGVVRLFDLATGQCRRELRGHQNGVWSVAFSPDGQRLASGSSDNTVRLWDVARGEPIAELRGHQNRVMSVAFSPDGQRLASGSDDNTVRLWDVARGEPIAELRGHQNGVRSVAFSPDGQRLASGSYDNTVRLWDVARGEPIAELRGHQNWVMSVAFSPDGQRLASGSSDNTVRLWDAARGEPIAELRGHQNWVMSVAFSPDGQRLASGSYDNTVRLWDVARGEPIAELRGHQNGVRSVAFSPDGQRLASGSDDNTVRLWDVARGEPIAELRGHQNRVMSVAFSPDGQRLASGSYDNTVRLWDVARGEPIAELRGHQNGVRSVAFSPDGQRLASGSDDNTVRLWDVARGEPIAELRGHQNRVMSVVFSPDGQRLASGSYDNTVRLWDVARGEPIAELRGHQNRVMSVVFSPDGQRLASGSYDNTVRLWDVARGEPIAELRGHQNWVMSVAFSPDGQRLASGSDDNTVRLWDVARGEPIAELRGHQNRVMSVAFSPDGQRLASGSYDNTVRLWDVARGEPIAELRGHQNRVMSVAFSPDGRHLASASWDQTIRLWDTTTHECLVIFHVLPDGAGAAVYPGDRFRANDAGKRYLTFVDDNFAIFPASRMPQFELKP